MVTEGLILSLLVSGALLLVGYRMRSKPVLFISSLGWMICGLQAFQQTEEILPMVLLMMLSFSQFFIVDGRRD